MLKIGTFSKLSHLTVKTLRFYEKEGLLIPAAVDSWTGYRSYETSQLLDAARIKACRQLGLTIDEIRAVVSGADQRQILAARADALAAQRQEIDVRLSIIHHLLEGDHMKYQVTVKDIPAAIVYSTEVRVGSFSEMMTIIPELGAECMAHNPGLRCAEPPYEFCEYLDEEHRDTDILIRHSEAVERMGVDSERIRFRQIPGVRVLSIYHRGGYDSIGEAYAYIMKYAGENGYTPAGPARECYIDGIWNKESEADWLTEVQLPIE